jgi:hypothetical protein
MGLRGKKRSAGRLTVRGAQVITPLDAVSARWILRRCRMRGIGASDPPALEHLDLWLGTPDYGGDSEAADLEPILSGARLPRLRHLALRNSEMQDAVTAAIAAASVVERLEVLDLSMGVLTDEGAAALRSGQPLTHLKKLDLHHNHLSETVAERIRQTPVPAGVDVDLDRDDAG